MCCSVIMEKKVSVQMLFTLPHSANYSMNLSLKFMCCSINLPLNSMCCSVSMETKVSVQMLCILPPSASFPQFFS